MELANFTASTFQQNQQQQQQTSLFQSNLHRWEDSDDCLNDKQSWDTTQRPSTSASITSTTPTILVSSSTTDNENSECPESNHRYCTTNHQAILGLDREKLIRYIYFGQITLVIIVALAWVAFTILELDPKTIIGNITTAGKQHGQIMPETSVSGRSLISSVSAVSLALTRDLTFAPILAIALAVIIHNYHLFH
uniref:PRA1 family protein n=1 Tax=Setaria digitata TaxID=48799 RepID=A0A915PTQ0_9BILA